MDPCTNTDNSLNSNNIPCNASLPMVKDNVAAYILSRTKETNNEIEYFLPGPNNKSKYQHNKTNPKGI